MKLTTASSVVSAAMLLAASDKPGARAFSPLPGTPTKSLTPMDAPLSPRFPASDLALDAHPRGDDFMTKLSPIDTSEEAPGSVDQSQNPSPGAKPPRDEDPCLVRKIVRPTQAHLEKALAESTISMIRGGETGDTAAFILHALNMLALGGTIEHLNGCFGALPTGAEEQSAGKH